MNKITDYKPPEILSALRKTKWNKSKSARLLGVSRAALRRWIRRYQTSPAPESRAAEESESPNLRELRDLERRLKQTDATLRSERAKRQDAEHELREALERADIFDQLTAPVAQPQAYAVKPGQTPATAVIAATDWHCEANVQPDIVSGLNTYNLDVFQGRVRRLWEKSVLLIDFARHLCSIRDAVLWLGGDLINGYIHEELEEGNFAGPTEAILFVQDAVAEGIETLLKTAKLDHLRVVCNFGNHGRSTKRRRISTGFKTSWEWLAYQNLARYFARSNVSWQIARGYFNYVDVQGYTCRFHHGDNIRYYGGVGGITIPVNKAIHQWNLSRRADYDFFGHYHQMLETPRWTACPCLSGYDAYALSIKAEYEEPAQAFAVIDKTRGKTMAFPIFVSNTKKRKV